MSKIYGPVKTYRNGLMNTEPGDVVVTNSQGTKVLKVEAKKLPTYEAYAYADGELGSYVVAEKGLNTNF